MAKRSGVAEVPLEPNPAPGLLATGASLRELADAVDGCRACPLYARATQGVFGRGPATADLMLVGEQPGDREDEEGEPFVGPAGVLLGTALARASIERSATYVTNVVKHFKWKPGPPSKPRLHAKPSRYEMEACHPWLTAEIARVAPRVIVCLGATAAKALLGDDVRVTRDHGIELEAEGVPAVATIHPAAVLRAGSGRDEMLEQLVADLRVARSLLRS